MATVLQLAYVTTNIGKLNSLKRALGRHPVELVHIPLEVPEPRLEDVEEVSVAKAFYAFRKLNRPLVVSDAGFYIFSLNGFPKTFVNFALGTIGLKGILKLVEGKERSCEFLECMSFIDSEVPIPKTFVGRVKGQLSMEPQGEMKDHLWSELWLIFIPEGASKTLAEMEYKEYLQWRKLSRETCSPARLFTEWFSQYANV